MIEKVDNSIVQAMQDSAQREVQAFERRDSLKCLTVETVGGKTVYMTHAFRDYLEAVGDTPESREFFKKALEKQSSDPRAPQLTALGCQVIRFGLENLGQKGLYLDEFGKQAKQAIKDVEEADTVKLYARPEILPTSLEPEDLEKIPSIDVRLKLPK